MSQTDAWEFGTDAAKQAHEFDSRASLAGSMFHINTALVRVWWPWARTSVAGDLPASLSLSLHASHQHFNSLTHAPAAYHVCQPVTDTDTLCLSSRLGMKSWRQFWHAHRKWIKCFPIIKKFNMMVLQTVSATERSRTKRSNCCHDSSLSQFLSWFTLTAQWCDHWAKIAQWPST